MGLPVIVVTIIVLILFALVIFRLIFRSNRNSTMWQANEYGSFEKCPHCGETLAQDLKFHGRFTASHSRQMQVNGRDVCPNCNQTITRSSRPTST